MEQIIPNAIADLLKIGTGWVLAVILAWGYYQRGKFIEDMLVKSTDTTARATKVNEDVLTVSRERVLTDKDMTTALQVLATKVENGTIAAKERADDIKRFIANERSE